MDAGLASLPLWAWVWVFAVFLFAGFMHGVMGFGFPLVATPLLAMVVDYKGAVLVSVLPGFLVTAVNAFSGEKTWRRLKRFWFMPAMALIGAYLGTKVLMRAPAEPFILLLAALLVLYLKRDRIGRRNKRFVQRHYKKIGAGVGFVGGFFEATANVGNGPYLIYFMILGTTTDSMVQTLNLCFLAGKTAQLAGWASSGVAAPFWALMFGFGALSVMALFTGESVRRRVDQKTYALWLRRFLWVMVLLLLAQFVWMVVQRLL